MKASILSIVLLAVLFTSCSSAKKKNELNNSSRSEYTITDIRNEKDGQTLFLSDDKGGKFTTVISIPNGNYVDVEKGDRISLVAKEILEMHPAIIISEHIKVLNSVSSHLNTNKNSFNINEPIELTMTLTNAGESSYRFLPWGTPIEKRFTGDCLTVTHSDGTAVNYTGIMVKRMAPTDKDYITLATGDSASGTVNLLDGYKLDKKGTYTIQFKETYQGLPASNTINVTIK